MVRSKLKRKGSAQTIVPAPAPALPSGLQRHIQLLLPAVLIVAVGLLAYHNSFVGSFLFDDEHAIEENVQIRRLWPFTRLADLRAGALTTLTLSLNYALGRLNPRGYHVVNLLVHLLAGLVLFGVVRRTLLLPQHERYHGRATSLGLAGALLWLIHPLQTESVTYIVQRSESMMGLFYLLTLYCTLRGATAMRGRWWYVAAAACCTLGVLSKEVALTAPLLVLLFDRVLLSSTWKAVVRDRWQLYVGLFASWAFLYPRAAGVLHFAPSPEATVGFSVAGITPLEYAQSQPGVILHYMQLVFCPIGLCLDYGWPVANGFEGVILPAATLTLLLGVSLWALVRRPGLGFCGVSFILVLAPTSSIVPLRDLAFEHRMYLPLAPLIVLVVLAADILWRAVSGKLFQDEIVRHVAGLSLLSATVGLLAVLTILRNEDYRTKLDMWADVVTKRPGNARGQNNLGNELVSQGQVEEGIRRLLTAIRLSPEYSLAHYNLGTALARQGRDSESANEFRAALRTRPDFAQAHYNLGNALSRQLKRKEALKHYAEATRLDPAFALAHFNFANVLVQSERYDEAICHYHEALRLEPDNGQFHGNLGGVLLRVGQLADAVEHFRQSLRQYPHVAPMHNNLGLTLLLLGKWQQAALCCQRATALEPNAATYHRNLAFALYEQGYPDAAKSHYEKSLLLEPQWPRESIREAWSLATNADRKRRNGQLAVFTAEQVLQAQSEESFEALDTLAAAYAEAGRFDKAVDVARRACDRAQSAGKTALAKAIQERLSLYRQRKPFRASDLRG
jgi:tetratricopeptide (TPR) repeat protein